MLRLVLREGRTSRSIRVEADRVVLGAAPDGGVAVRGAGVDRIHCRLQPDGSGGLQVVDLGSREGTILNGRRVGRAVVVAGDELILGAAGVTVLDVALAEAPLRGPAASAAGAFARPAGHRAAHEPPGFDESLYVALRGSPPWVFSIAAHVAAAALLFLLPDPAGGVAGPRTLMLSEDPASAGPWLEEEVSPPERAALPSLPDLPRAMDDGDPLAEAERRREAEAVETGDEVPDPGFRPTAAELGFGAPEGTRVGRSLPTRAVRFEGNPSFTGDGAEGANRAAAGLLRTSLGGDGATERRLAARIDARRLLVVSGAYDHVEEVLALMGVRHETLPPEDLELVPLDGRGMLIVDCGNDVLSPRAAARVRDFVAAGGYLATTDWGLENVIERAFPGVLRSLYAGGRGVYTKNEQVTIRLPRPGHELVRGMRSMGADAVWWVEDRAHPVEILEPDRVTVLVESESFARRYRGGALAVTFPHGAGHVLHLVGHAWQREGNLKGAYGMQRILMNFLLERVRSLRDVPDDGAATPPLPAASSAVAPPPERWRSR